jgi:hypothetical protein
MESRPSHLIFGELRTGEVRRILLPRNRVNKDKREGPENQKVSAYRGASLALTTRSSLSARTIVQGNHTAIVTRCTDPPHECSGASDGITRAKVATNKTTMAMPLASV